MSDLIRIDGTLYTGCDKTGQIYSLDEEGGSVEPVVTLYEGHPDEADESKSRFKIEWISEFGDQIYVGSHGRSDEKGRSVMKEVKVLTRSWEWVDSIDLSETYDALAGEAGTGGKGFLCHEAVTYNPNTSRWYFFPRKLYPDQDFDMDLYQNETGTNLLLTTDSDFGDIQVHTIGEVDPSTGYAAIAFLPEPYQHLAVLVKTRESTDGELGTYIVLVDTESQELLGEEFEVSTDAKYEGIECTGLEDEEGGEDADEGGDDAEEGGEDAEEGGEDEE